MIQILSKITPPAQLYNQLHISTWRTTSANESITLPITTGEDSQDFRILWGDGTPWQTIKDGIDATHIYKVAGDYDIEIIGIINGFRFASTGDRLKLINIKAWGDGFRIDGDRVFNGCTNLKITATDRPVITTSSVWRMFRDSGIDNIPNFNYWNFHNVTDTSELFRNVKGFNGFINLIDVSEVTNSAEMFRDSNISTPLDNLDFGKSLTMGSMFRDAQGNSSMRYWNTSSVTTMSAMFRGSTLNPDISWDEDTNTWNVANVSDMTNMFYDNTAWSNENYSKFLIGLKAQDDAGHTLQTGVRLDANTQKYTSGAAADARAWLISQRNWAIYDAGQV